MTLQILHLLDMKKDSSDMIRIDKGQFKKLVEEFTQEYSETLSRDELTMYYDFIEKK